MKHASQWALLSAAVVVGIAYSCATPVEVTGCPPGATSSNCDVTLVAASEFEGPDASVVAQGGGAGSNPSGSAGSGNNNPPPGGSAGTGSVSTGGSAGSGAAGSGQTAGTGGASGAAGSGAAGSGAGGAAGSAAAGAAGTGSGGTTAQSNFDPASCDFDNTTGCENLGCICAGEQCQGRCTGIVDCLKLNLACITEADPLCAVRPQGGGTKACTMVTETGGGVNADGNQPAGIVRALVNCVCSNPRP